MLSRIAESLFWIGRYTERADGTARIVDVLRLQLLEDPGADEAIAARTVLSVIMGMPFEGDVGFADVSAGARLRPLQRQLDHRRAGSPPARTPAAPARPSRPSCGRASTPRGTGGTASAARIATERHLSWVRERAALVSRHRRLDDVARRGLGLPGARPQPRAGRHDRAARRHRWPAPRRGAVVGRAVELRCATGVHAQPARPAQRRPGRRLPRARPRVPPLGVLRPVRGRAPARRPRPAAGPDRRPRRGAPPARPHPHLAGVPARPPTSSPTCPPRCSACRAPS